MIGDGGADGTADAAGQDGDDRRGCDKPPPTAAALVCGSGGRRQRLARRPGVGPPAEGRRVDGWFGGPERSEIVVVLHQCSLEVLPENDLGAC